MKRIVARVTKTGYMVLIGPDVYEMNAQADQPNGVCIYAGNVDDDSDLAYHVKALPVADELPMGVVRQVAYLLQRDPVPA